MLTGADGTQGRYMGVSIPNQNSRGSWTIDSEQLLCGSDEWMLLKYTLWMCVSK